MSALAQSIDSENTLNSITKISANARIDYILRFSKQAILVVDDQLAHCSTVANQFLGALPSDNNAAFISISPKLNNIQVRCRLIEQLFTDELFDPEQSIAVSLINLAKKNRQPLSIVVENAHLLSLQIIHELCQLAEIAKKANYQISVLMLGLPQAGVTVANNNGLFRKNLSILSAQTGQLLSLNSKLFKPKTLFFEFTAKKKLLSSLVFLAVSLLFALVYILQSDLSNFSYFSVSDASSSTDKQNAFVRVPEKEEIISSTIVETPQTATRKDIYLALMNQLPEATVIKKENKELEQALPQDILSAIEAPDNSTDVIIKARALANTINSIVAHASDVQNNKQDKSLEIEESKSIKPDLLQSKIAVTPALTPATIEENILLDSIQVQSAESTKPLTVFGKVDSEYFLKYQKGFVIQISGFMQKATFNEFINEHLDNQFHSYFRLFNNDNLLLVTSEVYSTKALAQQALLLLPETIQIREPWIKSITAVNNEINTFQRSQ